MPLNDGYPVAASRFRRIPNGRPEALVGCYGWPQRIDRTVARYRWLECVPLQRCLPGMHESSATVCRKGRTPSFGVCGERVRAVTTTRRQWRRRLRARAAFNVAGDWRNVCRPYGTYGGRERSRSHSAAPFRTARLRKTDGKVSELYLRAK